MKVKCRPDDFCVEELADVSLHKNGPYALYRLSKTSLTTLEAIEQIQRGWNISRKRLSWGGLKDKHAVTRQWMTIRHGSRQLLKGNGFSLSYEGQTTQPFGPQKIVGNRFTITIRDLSQNDETYATEFLTGIRQTGIPNYFDDQRFGSMTSAGEFVAEAWIAGDYERAIRLAFAEPNVHDRSQDKREKEILRKYWGDWPKCKRLLSKSHRRSIITFLDDRPGDFRGAFSRIKKDLRSLYLSAFQSAIWNDVLATFLRKTAGENHLTSVGLKSGHVCFFRHVEEAVWKSWSDTRIPLPCARTRLESISDSIVREIVVETLQKRGLEMRDFRAKHNRDVFFSKSWRDAVISAKDLAWTIEPDDMHTGRQALAVSFSLPRGSYATILLKSIQPDLSGDSSDEEAES